MTIVRNPDYPNQEHGFSLVPRDAVLAAYALYTMRDANSWDWERKYAPHVTEVANGKGFQCGGWFAHYSGR